VATASDPQLAGARSFELHRCERCGTAITVGVGPGPGALYEAGTYAEPRDWARRALAPLRALAERDRVRFVERLPAGARVLEIGAGDGDLVARMRDLGLDAWGLEPSPAADQAQAKGIEVVKVAVEQAEVEPASQDAVVLWHSLEHLGDPAGALGLIRSWLRPGGRIVVAVPNLAGLQARIGGDRWFHQDVPRHRTHFTSRGLTALLERHGFGVDRVRHLLVEQNPLGMWQTLLNRVTVERDFAFRLIKGDLGAVPGSTRARDLIVTGLAGALLAPLAVALELGAGLAGKGGSIVVEASMRSA
jgi:SAM-dependent methyltransferase